MDADTVPAVRQAGGAMRTVYDDLDAFFLEQRRCGELDGGVEGEWVWMTCDCGALLSRWPTRSPSATIAPP